MQQQTEMTATTDTRQRIRDFLAQNFLLRTDGFPYGDDASLLDEGVVDSTAVLELTLYLEETFGISIPDEEIVPDNLDSVDRIVAYIESKVG